MAADVRKGPLFALLRRLPASLKAWSSKTYLVGGGLRDLLLGRIPKDLDLVLPDPQGAARSLSAQLDASWFFLDPTREVIRIVLSESFHRQFHLEALDLAPIQGENIQEDLAGRDFTINALALPLEALGNVWEGESLLPHLIDPFQGLADLQARQIRALGPSAFERDPLRMLRAVRLTGEMGFSLAPQTQQWIQSRRKALSRVAGERIREEWTRIFHLESPFPTLHRAQACGLLETLPGNPRGPGSQALERVQRLEILIRSWKEIAPAEASLLSAGLEVPCSQGWTRRGLLRLAVLLFPLGPGACRNLSRGFRFSRRNQRFLDVLSRGRAAILKRRDPQGRTSWGILRRILHLYEQFGEDIPWILLFVRTGLGPEAGEVRALLQEMLTWFALRCSPPPPGLLRGEDLLSLGLPPGPEIGRILARVREGQLLGQIRTRQEALEWVRSCTVLPSGKYPDEVL